MWRHLPYRLQIPLGLSFAVMLSAALVTLISAAFSARASRADTDARIARAADLLRAQGATTLVADDTFRAFRLLRDTAALLPGREGNHASAALLDAKGRVFASSLPARFPIGRAMLGAGPPTDSNPHAPLPNAVQRRSILEDADGSVRLIDPVQSEDGQLLGYVYVEIGAPAFAPDWTALTRPALLGAVLSVLLLVPPGWVIGRRMTRPIADIARAIVGLGRVVPAGQERALPAVADAELSRIAAAVHRLRDEIDERVRAERRALSAERLAAVGRLTGAVAHEINNPLGGLLNAVQTLRLKGEDAAVRERAIELLARGLEQIRTTVAALLPQARIEDRALVPADLDDVLMLAHAATGRQTFDVIASVDTRATIVAPSAPLRQVMLNMLLNALKAAGPGGTVRAQLRADAERICFEVSNSGIALTAGTMQRLLTAESGDDPRGFGLWVCHELALLYGGGFDLVDAGEGMTRLVFWVPNRAPDTARRDV